MAWWQKKLLHYALSHTGLLDDKAIDPKNLDIAFGKKSVVELKDVGLNIKRLTKLAQLPSNLRVETARVLVLRLTVPSDIYQSSIVTEIDGLVLGLRLEEREEEDSEPQKTRARSPTASRTPQHRKVHRRPHSPPPYDSGGLSESDEDIHIPTTQELAKSFLLDEPAQERRELEASLAADSNALEESIVSESSEGDVGTGASVGLPGFLAGFLQGIVDRLQVRVRNIEVSIETVVSGDGQETVPLALRLTIGSAELEALSTVKSNDKHDGKRQITLQGIGLDLVSDATVFSELSELPSRASPAGSRMPKYSASAEVASTTSPIAQSRLGSMSASASPSVASSSSHADDRQVGSKLLQSQCRTAESSRVTHTGDDRADSHGTSQRDSTVSDLDIQPGDDNISWGSRRNKSGAPSEDLWNSVASEDDLPDSLLIERAATPRPYSLNAQSPVATRSRHAVSPYDRSLQSPGSWPNLDESPERYNLRPSPGSWPMLDQSHEGLSMPLTSPDREVIRGTMDNKRAALESSALISDDSSIPSELADEQAEDMTQSRLYSHEEAESMYMSAMTHSSRLNVPGGWASESMRDGSPPTAVAEGAESIGHNNQSQLDGSKSSQHFDSPPGNATPRALSPQPDLPHDAQTSSRRLVSVDAVSVWLPLQAKEASSGDAPYQSPQHQQASTPVHGMPGAFSAYQDVTSARRKSTSLSESQARSIFSLPEHVNMTEDHNNLNIHVGTVKAQVDIPCGRLLYYFGRSAAASLSPRPKQSAVKEETHAADGDGLPFHLLVDNFELALVDHVPQSQQLVDNSEQPLLAIRCGKVSLDTRHAETCLHIGRGNVFLGSVELLAFERQARPDDSLILTDDKPDISLTIASNRFTITKRPVTDIALQTLRVRLNFDLPVLDETLSSFGGISGVLELSNSILSEGVTLGSPTLPAKSSKGVRFQGDPEATSTAPELKINGRFAGCDVWISGEFCRVTLRSNVIKLIYREQATSVVIDSTCLTGPLLNNNSTTIPLSLDLSGLRLDYLPSPQDKDLERLLTLLTPSKDKYDTDDDILIDTLLRQRRKGALARVTATRVHLHIADYGCFATLAALGDELAKLSAVAKYLPEDDRPGLLTLLRVSTFEAQLRVNERFGDMLLDCSDFQTAHVGLPALLALSVGTVNAGEVGGANVLHPLIPQSGTDSLPMLMARMLGNEAEPSAKVKLYNLCLEYSVPTLLALTNMDVGTKAEDVVTGLAQSVADMALLRKDSASSRRSPDDDTTGQAAKRTVLDLLVHESAIGLIPEKLPSKGIIVLTDAAFSTKIPAGDELDATLELRKAAVFVTDAVREDGAGPESQSRSSRSDNTATSLRLTDFLSKQGYASVGSLLSTKVSVLSETGGDGHSHSIAINVRNELLLLETCADSTQTLISVLGALSPPSPPSAQPKYLTEPMTIEDMMASFTGEPEAKPEAVPEMLFDVDEVSGDDPDMLLDAPTMGEEQDDLLAESEMTSSLYGPVSGMLEGFNKPDDDESGTGEFTETVESLLEEDPFEMPGSPTDMRLSDSALMRDLRKQCKPAVSDGSVDLGIYEVEDLGFDALGTDGSALGAQNRFGAPTSARKPVLPRAPPQKPPFRLHLQDTHVIWNIYDGYDWQRTREAIREAVEHVEIEAEERKARRRQSHNEREEDESVIGDFLFNSIYIGVPANLDAQELRRQINRGIDDLASETESIPVSGMSRPTNFSAAGRPLRQRQRRRLKLERSKNHKVAFELKGVSADMVVFPPDSGDVVSSIDIRVRDCEIFDNVPTSTWRKFLTRLDSDPSSREMSKPMAHIELANVRTLEAFSASEIVLHVSLLPLRLHVDQDALDFITRFFEFKENAAAKTESPGEQPFLQRIEVDTVDLRLDYKPKHIDYAGLRSGHTTEFMNFVTLDAANIRLKHAIVYGIRGFEPLHKTLNDIWMPDVRRNQLPTVLAGLAPVRSLVNIGSGVRDVVAIPIREYKKDGRIVRSIQKGAFQFGKTTASELARLGAKVAIGTQNILQGAEGFLSLASASPSGRPSSEQGWHDVASDDDDEREQRAISAYADQPIGLLPGLRSARRHLEHDLLTAKDALIAVQGEVLDSRTPGAAAAAVVKHAPTVILRPVIGASRAVGTTLLGVGNQIDRSNVRRMEDKYKHR